MTVMNITNHSNGLQAMRGGKAVGLALQGGGSWGAYAWGVLDTLLQCPEIVVTQMSGTSAGALNAAIVASALAKGSRKQAREALTSFWGRVANPPTADLMRAMMGSLGRHWRSSVGNWLMASEAFSVPGVHALGVNPLRDVVAAHVDIEAIRGDSAPALFVTATNVRTGLPRVFSNADMSVDALLASACLPHMFPTVEIDGEHYWDGGYTGNPTLWPMIRSGLAKDLILVQLMPEGLDDLPLDAPSIRRRVGQIVFNSSIGAEMQALVALRELAAQPGARAKAPDVRMHRIGPPHLELFEEGSGSDRGVAWLKLLNEEGAAAGRRFLSHHLIDVGIRETLDIARVFFDPRDSRVGVPQSLQLPTTSAS